MIIHPAVRALFPLRVFFTTSLPPADHVVVLFPTLISVFKLLVTKAWLIKVTGDAPL
jgi:hypothetical protein